MLAFPGVFKGALAACASDITEDMKLAAAHNLARYAQSLDTFDAKHILPDALDKQVACMVARAVADAWRAQTGNASAKNREVCSD